MKPVNNEIAATAHAIRTLELRRLSMQLARLPLPGHAEIDAISDAVRRLDGSQPMDRAAR